jgi:antitoxin component HigA of HigAB toxin-antitoxin module
MDIKPNRTDTDHKAALMESRGLNRADLIPYLGSKERVPEILNRKRGLSLEMIRRLHSGAGIPADPLIGKLAPSPSRTRQAHKRPLQAV